MDNSLFFGFATLLVSVCSQTNTAFVYSVFEYSPEGTYVGDVSTDAFRTGELTPDPAVTFTYQILSQGNTNADYFSITEDAGILRTSKLINRDELCPNLDECPLKLDIAVKGDPDIFVILKVTVNVQDLNNNAPKWPESEITRSIPENTPIDSSFSIPNADDPDSRKYSIKSYELAEGTPQFDLKVRNISGAIDLYLVVKMMLDREQMDVYKVKVIAYDGGVPSKSGTLTVDVNIQDNNDNRPKFDKEFYETTVYEDTPAGSPVIAVMATDRDAGVNGEIIYAFAKRTLENFGDIFDINSQSGEITLKEKLDYETRTAFNLFVTAQEKNPEHLPAEVRVTIKVADINDHKPQISVNSLTTSGRVEISESSPPGSFLAHITVSDPDAGHNGDFRCMLNNPSQEFSIDQRYSNEFTLKTAARFDRELVDKYNVIFQCVDNGSPALTGSAEISVDILDENDNYPKFPENLYTIELQENNEVGLFLMQFSATDNDIGPNGNIQYTIHNSAQNFVNYDPKSGNLTARISFDYERFQSITFQITAQDQGKPPKSGSTTVVIKINDINDEAPEFLMPKYVFGVYESQEAGAEVGVVSAIDRDKAPNNEFIYSMKPDLDNLDIFVIEPLSGRILTKQELDREVLDSYDMVVIATDKNDPSLSSTVSVSVYVADINDQTPQIDFPNVNNNTVYVSNKNKGRLPRIIADDDDIEQNGKLLYKIESEDNNDAFIVDENSGQLYLQKELHLLDKKSYIIDVIVQDHGAVPLLARGTLVIIINATDNAPPSAIGLISGNNLIIVIVVAIVSGIITLVLVAAIIVLKRQDIRARKNRSVATPGIDSDTESGKGEKHTKKEVSFSTDVEDLERGSKYDTCDKKVYNQPANLGDLQLYQQQIVKQTKADKQWQMQHYLSKMHEQQDDTMSVHSNADSGMGSNEEHNVPSPDRKHCKVHPPVPPRAPIGRNSYRKPNSNNKNDKNAGSPDSDTYPQIHKSGRSIGGIPTVKTGYYDNYSNVNNADTNSDPRRPDISDYPMYNPGSNQYKVMLDSNTFSHTSSVI